MKRCFLDLDGVLVDFVQGALDVHGITTPLEEIYEGNLGEWEVTKLLKMPAAAFWKPMNEEFWAKLEWTPDGEQLLKIIEQRFGRENICLLTSPCANYGCYDGKKRWVERHLPRHYKSHMIVGSKKHLCASSNVILIDDADHNIDSFIAHEGHGLLVPRISNTAHSMRHETVQHVARILGV